MAKVKFFTRYRDAARRVVALGMQKVAKKRAVQLQTELQRVGLAAKVEPTVIRIVGDRITTTLRVTTERPDVVGDAGDIRLQRVALGLVQIDEEIPPHTIVGNPYLTFPARGKVKGRGGRIPRFVRVRIVQHPGVQAGPALDRALAALREKGVL